MKCPACCDIIAMTSREPDMMCGSSSPNRDTNSGQRVLTRGRKEFSWRARAGMVVEMRERREVLNDGDEDDR